MFVQNSSLRSQRIIKYYEERRKKGIVRAPTRLGALTPQNVIVKQTLSNKKYWKEKGWRFNNELNPCVKLTNEAALSIFEEAIIYACHVFEFGYDDLLPEIKTYEEIAKKYNCHPVTVLWIVSGMQWSSITHQKRIMFFKQWHLYRKKTHVLRGCFSKQWRDNNPEEMERIKKSKSEKMKEYWKNTTKIPFTKKDGTSRKIGVHPKFPNGYKKKNL